jgi:RNA polymerase sigma-70 factor, ECF subfamily
VESLQSSAPAAARAEAAKPTDLRSLFSEFSPYVFRALRRLGVAEADVDDACQEVFLVVHRKASDFEGRSSMKTWIFSIAIHVAQSFRRKARDRHVGGAVEEEVTHGHTGESAYERAELVRMLDAALSTLDDERREAFVLYELEQFTIAEVAEALGCPLQTAYSRLMTAREQVQSILKKRMRGTQ